METTLRVRLSETAAAELLELMEWWGHTNPTHSANTAISYLYKQTLKHRSLNEEQNNGNSSIR